MRALESTPDLSQRDLARELGVSLGKTHYCLRALIDKGHVKAVNFKNSGAKHRYILSNPKRYCCEVSYYAQISAAQD